MALLYLSRTRLLTKRSLSYTVLLLLLYYLFIRTRKVSEKFEFTINSAKPKVVWEYWADFSNYKNINPTVIDFTITSEHGTYQNWEYGVTYREHLTQLPFIVHINARFIVTPEDKKGHFTEPFRIVSEHDSCVYLFCAHTSADMTFTPTVDGKGTKITEVITTDVPIMFTWYALGEMRKQRREIRGQLEIVDFDGV